MAATGPFPAATPTLEVTLARNQAYVQQSLILKLRVISAGALASATLSLDGGEGAQTQLLQGPVTHMREGTGGREQVNDYYFLVRPLRGGTLRLAPVELSAMDTRGQRFALEAPPAPEIEVRPAPPDVRPWLPLEALSLVARLDPNAVIAAGQPLTLTLELQAEGGTAEQLPSLEPLLASGDFRHYRERTLTDTRLEADGGRLLARRTEVYTLVPQSDGALQLPPMRVRWWNLGTDRLEVASLAQRSLGRGARGEPGSGKAAEGFGLGSWGAWIPLTAVVLVVFGLVAGWRVKIDLGPFGRAMSTRSKAKAFASASAEDAHARHNPPRERKRDAREAQGRDGWRDWRALLPRLGRSPRLAWSVGGLRARAALYWSGLRGRSGAWIKAAGGQVADAAANAMPAPWRVSHWLRDSRACREPEVLLTLLRQRARRAGWLAPGEPLTRLAERILGPVRGASAGQVRASEAAAWQGELRALFAELEATRYGGKPIDLMAWKRRLRRQLRWRFGGTRLPRRAFPDRALPDLNPALNPPEAYRQGQPGG